ncbi:MAG: hypothetical protein ACRD8W_09990 [Nitrososphaeraceae archaeon]
MGRTNSTDFIKQLDNNKISVEAAAVQYHTWRLVQKENGLLVSEL